MAETGIDVDLLASEVGIDADRIEQWLDGEEQPGTTEFRKLAKALNRPTLFFLQSEPPEKPSIPPDFRRHPGDDEDRPFSSAEDKALRSARRLQRVVAWARLKAERQFDPLIPDPLPEGRIAAAGAMRKHLAWTVAAQLDATSTGRMLSQLRARFEDRGMLVMLLPMGRGACRGFALHDEVAPLAAINSAQTPEARVFSLLHEVGHLIRGQDAFDVSYGEDSAGEKWCDQFAAAFLLPKGAITSYVNERFGGYVNSLAHARTVANKFHVSLVATCIRLQRLDLSPSSLYGQIPTSDHWKPTGESGFNPDPSTAGKRFREFGLAVVSEIVEAEALGHLREHDIQRYLRVSDDKLTDVTQRLEDLNPAAADVAYGDD